MGTILFGQNSKRLNRLFREGGWLFLGQLVSVIGSLILIRVLTQYLNPAQYGHLALALTIATLVNQVVMGGIINGISRFYSIANEVGDLSGYLRSSYRLMTCATLAVGLIAVLLISALIWIDRFDWVSLALITLIFSVLSGINAALSGLQSAARKRSVVALFGGMDACLKIGFSIIAIYWLGEASFAVVLGYALSLLITVACQALYLKRTVLKGVAKKSSYEINEWTNKIWEFSKPFSIFGIFTWAQLSSDRWALENFSTADELGQYVVVFQLGYVPIGMVINLLVAFIGPIFYQRSGSANDPARNLLVHQVAWRLTFAALVLTLVVFLLSLLTHAWLFKYLVSEEFRATSKFFPWIILSGGIFAAGQILALKLMSELRQTKLIVLKIVSSLIGISLNIVGAWLFGVLGVVVSLFIFSVLYFCWIALVAKFKITH